METARDHVDDVVRYLAQHRIKAERRVEIIQASSGSRADQIIGWADDEDADLLVTGAYGHSRLNEWIFGGMTRDLLTTSPICCLIEVTSCARIIRFDRNSLNRHRLHGGGALSRENKQTKLRVWSKRSRSTSNARFR
ncbi:universal stress protein (plasmid) [Nitrobacter sp. NHB1]|uniref:universal stress protein n=1 Tax=Nitrobacter sp. NHB1 TaxID=3119830 RepID=UPI002FFE60E6